MNNLRQGGLVGHTSAPPANEQDLARILKVKFEDIKAEEDTDRS
jgi:hypothetical protein